MHNLKVPLLPFPSPFSHSLSFTPTQKKLKERRNEQDDILFNLIQVAGRVSHNT